MSNWFQDIRSFLRSDFDADYDQRVMNAPRDLREAAGEQIVRWEKGVPRWLEKDVRRFDRQAHRRVALIFACVQYLSDAAATAPLRVMRGVEGQEVEDDKHPLARLLKRPNDGQGPAGFISFVTMMAAVTGFAVIEKERDQYGRVIGLWVLRSDWLRPVPRSAGVTDWEYTVPGHDRPYRVDSEDAISVTYADVITGEPTGISPIEVIFQQAQILNDLDDFIKVFLERGAMPLYMALPVTEGPLASQWNNPKTTSAFREKVRQIYGGVKSDESIFISPAIRDVKALGFNFNELALKDLRSVNEADITTAFGIPPILLNTLYGLEHATYSNYEQARRAFYEDKMVPWWARLDDALTRHLMPEFETGADYNLVFDYADIPALREDEDSRHTRAVAAFQSGLVSRATAQRAAGYAPHGSDVFLVPFSSVQEPVTGSSRSREATARIEVPAIGAGVDTRAVDNQIAAHQRETMLKCARSLEPRIETFLREQGERVIAEATNIRADDSFDVRAIEQYDWFADDDELLDIMREWWAQVTEVAFGEAAALLSVDFDFDAGNPFLAEIENLLGYRIRGINETTRKQVEDVIRESLIEGTTIPDLKQQLEDLIEPTYKNRATTIARTESQVALNAATERAYASTGQVSSVRIHDNPLCHEPTGYMGLSCADRSGMVVPLSEMSRHSMGTHPNCIIAFSPVVNPVIGGSA